MVFISLKHLVIITLCPGSGCLSPDNIIEVNSKMIVLIVLCCLINGDSALANFDLAANGTKNEESVFT